MKRKIQRMISQKKRVPECARWLLDEPISGYTVLLDEQVTFRHKKYKEFVNWPHFKDLAPKDLIIPSFIKQLRLTEEKKIEMVVDEKVVPESNPVM